MQKKQKKKNRKCLICIFANTVNVSSTYLNIVWRWLVAGSLEGLCHIAEDLHWRE